MSYKWKVILVALYFPVIINCIDPFTLSLVASTTTGVDAFYNTIYCMFKDCCSDDLINYEISEIDEDFDRKLIGQHLVKKIVPKIVKAHIKRDNPNKALVLSFHGSTGNGKNFVADIIARHVYKKGSYSQFVHKYIADIHFPHRGEIKKYKKELKAKIIVETKKCKRSMFIFDEIEKMPPGIFDVLKPYLDTHSLIDGVDYKKNIFLFLGNTAGDAIDSKTFDHLKKGNSRESITIKTMQHIISKISCQTGGLKNSNLFPVALIDFFVPFLPMERKHVRECVRAEMQKRGIIVKETVVNKVADELEYSSKYEQLFSTSGCKRVSKTLDIYVEENYELQKLCYPEEV